jgi:biotin carboxyl carrier protein
MDWLVIDGRPYELSFDRDLHWVRTQTGVYPVEIRDLEAVVSRPSSADGRVKAPIPGMITRLLVEEGDTVDVGQPLLILEAMKMENEIRAPRAGTVSSIHVGLNQTVIRNTTLVEIT